MKTGNRQIRATTS